MPTVWPIVAFIRKYIHPNTEEIMNDVMFTQRVRRGSPAMIATAVLAFAVCACASNVGVEPAAPASREAEAGGKSGVRLMDVTPIEDEGFEAEAVAADPEPDYQFYYKELHVFSPRANYSERVWITHNATPILFSRMEGTDGHNWGHYQSGPKASIYHTY